MSTGGERQSGTSGAHGAVASSATPSSELSRTSRAPSARDVELAERVRRRLVEHALDAYEDARMQGLCAEGAFEAAVSALRTFDVRAFVDDAGGER